MYNTCACISWKKLDISKDFALLKCQQNVFPWRYSADDDVDFDYSYGN